jgi:hypothetical protein
MDTIKSQVNNLTANPIGAIAGGVAFYYGAKKFASVSNKWALGGIVVVGLIAGAMAQKAIFAKPAPTAASTK